MEAAFFEAAALSNCQMMKGCWWQQPAELAERYLDKGLDFNALQREGYLSVVDLRSAYLAGGSRAAVGLWQQALADCQTSTLWAAGSPAPQCFTQGGTASMLDFESQLDRALAGQAVVGLCTYSFDDLTEDAFFWINALARCHDSMLLFDDGRFVSLSRR